MQLHRHAEMQTQRAQQKDLLRCAHAASNRGCRQWCTGRARWQSPMRTRCSGTRRAHRPAARAPRCHGCHRHSGGRSQIGSAIGCVYTHTHRQRILYLCFTSLVSVGMQMGRVGALSMVSVVKTGTAPCRASPEPLPLGHEAPGVRRASNVGAAEAIAGARPAARGLQGGKISFGLIQIKKKVNICGVRFKTNEKKKLKKKKKKKKGKKKKKKKKKKSDVLF
jgi:hypothetical protein